ncbi:MAG: methionine ABC transporter ATP-binding protein [Ponticaulis sp.]|nr:methionine ABC transporter ATP-binding protein [Ponticaulis sp.]|tara:strand:+ start:10836 stop:11534 length:699 start_codon:yes stop_codon:yes gene_type:complete
MLLELKSVEFAWKGQPPFLQIPEFQIAEGEQLFLKGPSGSGKSTLLGLIAGVLSAQSGEIIFDGGDFQKMSNGRRDQIRARDMGVIFQLFNLLPYLDLVSNVALPCRLSVERRDRVLETASSPEDEALRLLEQLGLAEEAANKKPVSDLSVGQQQRVAAARALIGRPKLVIADEPTSALDEAARDGFLDLLQSECDRTGSALLFVSHDRELSDRFKRVVSLADLNTLTREPA